MGLEESEWSASIRDPRTGVQSTEDPLSRVAEWFRGGCLARKAGNASFAGTCQERACENSTTHVVRVTCGAALPAEQACLDWPGFPRVAAGPRRGAVWRLTQGCWLSGASCGDRFHWCALVPQRGVCGHRFYGQQCCKACSTSSL